jgi:hypothetical protein
VWSRADRATTAWARRNGKWWAVFTQSTVLENAGSQSKVTGTDHRWKAAYTWEMNAMRMLGEERTDLVKPDGLSETLKKLNSETSAPKE